MVLDLKRLSDDLDSLFDIFLVLLGLELEVLDLLLYVEVRVGAGAVGGVTCLDAALVGDVHRSASGCWLLYNELHSRYRDEAAKDDEKELLEGVEAGFLHDDGACSDVQKDERGLVNGNGIDLLVKLHTSIDRFELQYSNAQGHSHIHV